LGSLQSSACAVARLASGPAPHFFAGRSTVNGAEGGDDLALFVVKRDDDWPKCEKLNVDMVLCFLWGKFIHFSIKEKGPSGILDAPEAGVGVGIVLAEPIPERTTQQA